MVQARLFYLNGGDKIDDQNGTEKEKKKSAEETKRLYHTTQIPRAQLRHGRNIHHALVMATSCSRLAMTGTMIST